MDFVRGLWSKHRRKILVTTGCLGSGYLLYKLYNSHTRRLADLVRDLDNERATDEIIKNQMKDHFESIQRIVDSTTLPHAVEYLSIRISEEINVSDIMDRLNKGKGILSPSEKLQLWDELKLLSFTRMVLSLWSVTMLSLYIRVQVNILGRHLYVDTARALGGSHILEDLDLIDRNDEQKFLSSADFLVTNALRSLISDMAGAVREVLKGKQLRDIFTTRVLQETVMRIIDVFMSTGSPHHWVDYLMTPQDWVDYLMTPQDAKLSSNTGGSSDETVSKFHQLMAETREVLISIEFTNMVEISLKCFTDALVEDMETQTISGGLATGIPLAKVLPHIEKIVHVITVEPSKNQYLQLIRNLAEVQLFFTLLYANMPP